MKKLAVGILAHVDAGKTTLSEGMLYRCGCLKKLGRVDHQDAFLDTDTLERERGITIFSKQAILPLGEWEITLLDTPGLFQRDGADVAGVGLCDSSHQWDGWRPRPYVDALASAQAVSDSNVPVCQ